MDLLDLNDATRVTTPESDDGGSRGYPGSKAGSGTYQFLINHMPPHSVYVEPFLGMGAIMRKKRPAPAGNIGIDVDGEVVLNFKNRYARFLKSLPNAHIICENALKWLANHHLPEIDTKYKMSEFGSIKHRCPKLYACRLEMYSFDEWQNRPIEDELQARINELEEYNARLENTLERIANWTRAYPIDVFPEPDWERVHEVLAAGGISMDCVSASNMRHVVNGITELVTDTTEEDDK